MASILIGRWIGELTPNVFILSNKKRRFSLQSFHLPLQKKKFNYLLSLSQKRTVPNDGRDTFLPFMFVFEDSIFIYERAKCLASYFIMIFWFWRDNVVNNLKRIYVYVRVYVVMVVVVVVCTLFLYGIELWVFILTRRISCVLCAHIKRLLKRKTFGNSVDNGKLLGCYL